MKCEMCEDERSEYVGIRCTKYKICFDCIDGLISDRMRILGRGK